MRYSIVSSVLISILFVLSACSPKTSETVLAEFDDTKITVDDFEKAYAKNAGGEEQARKDSVEQYKKFLDLYLNFKMKLKDAEAKNYSSREELNAELADYKTRVGISYITEKEIIEPGVKSLYEKRLFELRASHIMIRPDSLSNEEAKQLAKEIINKINNGESYEELAKKYSADQFSKNDGGDIYYITAGQIVPEFEDACYKTEVGKIYPEPVETRYGFHIIKVSEKQSRKDKVRARHILIDFNNEEGQPDTSAALVKATRIREDILAGGNFEELVKKYSVDKGSAEKGGDLGLFERRMMVKEFDEVAFSLNVGQTSDIIKTRFGFHIIQVTEIQNIPPFEEDKARVKNIYSRTRYDQDYKDYITALKTEFGYKLNQSGFDFITSNTDSAKIDGRFYESAYREKTKDTVVFKIGNTSFIADSVFSFAISELKFKGRLADAALISEAVDKFSGNKLIEKKAEILDKTNKDFADLMEDYKNGIYIFKLQEEEIWNKIQVDSVKLVEYYNQTKENYVWPDRVDYSEIYSLKDSLIKHYYSNLAEGADFDSLAKKYTERPGYQQKEGNWGIQEVSKSEASKAAYSLNAEGQYSKPFRNGGGWSIVKLNKKLPSAKKAFEDAKAEVASAFQESESKRLENDYVSRLKEQYKPKVFYDQLQNAFKQAGN